MDARKPSNGGSDNYVEVHVLDPKKDYPGERPYPLAYLIPRLEWELDEGEVWGPTALDLLHHVKRLEEVRQTWEDLFAAENDRLRDALRKLDEQDDLINRLASVVNTANEYVAAHPCEHPSGCAYRDDLNRSISYAPGDKKRPPEGDRLA